ncbi:MAG: YdeI family protein [Maribacter sp.]
MEKSEKVEHYYSEEHIFSKAIGKLRDLALKTGMEETYKWMFPTYTLDGKNVISICKFKKHFGIWFFNGVFLKDEKQVLENAQEGKTQAMRHWKFYSIEDIDETGVLGYMNEAIENQKNGRILVPIKKKATIKPVPELLKNALAVNTIASQAFKKLSIYSQNEYSEYIENAKQEKTKLSRLEKIIPMISDGKGLNDMYR